MKIKTSGLTLPQLNWAVATCADKHVTVADVCWGNYEPSTNPAQAYPIIEHHIFRLQDCDALDEVPERWLAEAGDGVITFGPTMLIAAMRCYVTSKLGDEVDIPKELK